MSCLLVMAGAAGAGAYEHATTMPSQAGISYNTIVNRAGYAPLPISITPTKIKLIPTVNLEYVTCHYKTGMDSPAIKCCGSQECTPTYRPDEQCKVFTGVYPFMWGGAYCFCDTENTQVSKAYVMKSDDCLADHAEAYKAHTASVQAFLNITVGEHSIVTTVYVNGETPVNFNGVKITAGPLYRTMRYARPCHIVDGHGYFLLARCPAGDSITMEFKKDSVRHSCSVPYEVKFNPVGRELYTHPPEHGVEQACQVYAHDAQNRGAYVEMHLPGSEVDSSLVSLSGSSVTVTPPDGTSALVECECGGTKISEQT